MGSCGRLTLQAGVEPCALSGEGCQGKENGAEEYDFRDSEVVYVFHGKHDFWKIWKLQPPLPNIRLRLTIGANPERVRRVPLGVNSFSP